MMDERIVGALTPPAQTQLGQRIPHSQGESGTQPSRNDGPLARDELAALIEKEYVGLRLLIARRAGDPQLGADLLNEAICTAWEKWQIGQIERPQQIAGYVFQVAMNLLRNHRRAMGARPEKRASPSELDALPASGEPRDQLMESEIAVRVKALIRDMESQRDREALVRFYLNEEDKELICRDLRLSPLQFDKVLYRARKRLRVLLETRGLSRSDLFSLLIVVATVACWRV
jgi:RNA polymerase sigma-70 factor (ECF subfamily)